MTIVPVPTVELSKRWLTRKYLLICWQQFSGVRLVTASHAGVKKLLSVVMWQELTELVDTRPESLVSTSKSPAIGNGLIQIECPVTIPELQRSHSAMEATLRIRIHLFALLPLDLEK
ncbi:hypothetical protein Mapa_016178 [Marchantia paleacea]|nr:hypothetical protein Mapa_016178 [Marchantia paleacea]